MTILKETKGFLKEDSYKIKSASSLSGWQKTIYSLITKRLASTILDKMMEHANKALPEDAEPEEIKEAVQTALLDYIDSVF